MASTIGLTGLLSSDDSDDTKDLYVILNTAADPSSGSITMTAQVDNTSPFESSNPIAVVNAAGIKSATGSFNAFFPRDGAAYGDGGLVTFANGYTENISGYTLNLSCQSFLDTKQASTPPEFHSYIPGEISFSGSYQCNIDDTTAHSLPSTSGAATFRLNTDTAANTLAGTIIVQSVNWNVERGAKNNATVNFIGSGNLTSAGTNPLFAAGALTTPDVTDIVLRAEGDIDWDGSAFWTALNITCNIGAPITIAGSLQCTGAYALGS
jgi:hypothetical protein